MFRSALEPSTWGTFAQAGGLLGNSARLAHSFFGPILRVMDLSEIRFGVLRQGAPGSNRSVLGTSRFSGRVAQKTTAPFVLFLGVLGSLGLALFD